MDSPNINLPNDERIVFNGIISKEEFIKLAEAVRRADGSIDEKKVAKLVNWAIEKRTGVECLNLLFEGFLTIDGWDGDDPNFGVPEIALQTAEAIG